MLRVHKCHTRVYLLPLTEAHAGKDLVQEISVSYEVARFKVPANVVTFTKPEGN